MVKRTFLMFVAKNVIANTPCTLTNKTILPFECPVCKKAFKSKIYMGVHQETHKKNRTGDFHCKECGKSFLYKKTLKTHQLTHSENADQFKCKVCDKEFRLKDYLKKHELIHDIERMFSCHLTRKKYSTSNDLSTHLHLHKNKSFACKRCPKTFKFLIRLERHERWHKNIEDRGYVCKTCDKTFSCKWHLDNHYRQCDKDSYAKLTEEERKPFTCRKKTFYVQ